MTDSTRPNDAPAPRHVALALATSGPGGAEHMVLMLANALRDLGLRVTLVTMRPGWMTERAERDGFPVWLEPQKPGIDLPWVARFARRLRAEGVDVLHAHEYEMNAYGGLAAAIARIPSVATIHGSVWGVDHKRHQLAYALVRLLGRQRVVAVSEELAQRLSKSLRRSRKSLDLVANGIPMPARPPERSAQDQRAARRQAGLPEDVRLVLAVGNLYPVKDHASLIRALARMREPAHVAIAGRGDEEERLRELIRELDLAERVHLLGLRDDIPTLLRAADVFVQPSLSEGLPLAVLEAMAAELPVVASDVGGVSEAVLPDETGLLTPAASPDALAEALDRLLKDPALAQRFARAGFERAREHFSVERMARLYVDLYDALTGRRTP